MNKKILNVGCGSDTYGTHFVDLYPLRSEVKKCDLDYQKLPFKSNYFDEVYCKNVLEHLTNLGFAIKEMKRVLKPNGKIKIITDNSNYWRWSFFEDHGIIYEKSKLGKLDKHYMLFTPSHLRNLMNKYGFTKIKIRLIDAKGIQKRNIKGFIKFIVNHILRITPLKNMSYQLIMVEATKK